MSQVLSHRSLAMLRAVAAGRARISCSCEPDLFIDGLPCCDQTASHELARYGLIRPVTAGARGCIVPVELTAIGRAALADTAPEVSAARVA